MVRRWENGVPGEPRELLEIHETHARIGIGFSWGVVDWDRLGHADGAPIDVEVSLRIARGEPTEMSYDSPRLKLGTPEHKAAVSAIVAEQENLLRRIAEDNDRLVAPKLQADLDAAEKRIVELEAERPGHSVGCDRKLSDAQACIKSLAEQLEVYRGAAVRSHARANQIGDEAGALRTEIQAVKAELCDALREVERLKRKAGAK